MRKSYSPEFKAKLVLEVFRGERMLNEIASENNVHPNMLTRWKTEESKPFILGGVLRAAYAKVLIERWPYSHPNSWLNYQDESECSTCNLRPAPPALCPASPAITRRNALISLTERSPPGRCSHGGLCQADSRHGCRVSANPPHAIPIPALLVKCVPQPQPGRPDKAPEEQDRLHGIARSHSLKTSP